MLQVKGFDILKNMGGREVLFPPSSDPPFFLFSEAKAKGKREKALSLA